MDTPLVLLHGWAGSFVHTWQRSGLVDLLQDAGRNVLAYDLPGHGTAEKSHDPATYAQMPEAFLAHLDGHSVVDAVGFSLGAITLLHALVAAPHRFRKVILAGIGDGVFQPHDPVSTERILAALEKRSDPSDITARIFGKIGNENNNDPVALAAVLRRPRAAPVTDAQLGAIPNQVLLVLGDEDFTYPADRLAGALPNARLLTLKGIDHFRTPDTFEFIDAVLDFLRT
jgi:pimeloyl-ACP methyl ester carboxylesterase